MLDRQALSVPQVSPVFPDVQDQQDLKETEDGQDPLENPENKDTQVPKVLEELKVLQVAPELACVRTWIPSFWYLPELSPGFQSKQKLIILLIIMIINLAEEVLEATADTVKNKIDHL